jgi:hypothetical protein
LAEAAAQRDYNPGMIPAAGGELPGPVERTCLEIAALERAAVFRRRRVSRAREHVQETDALLDLVEECRLRGSRLVPSNLWSAVVQRVGRVDLQARETLGINRDPGRVEDAIYTAQEVLLRRAMETRQPRLAPIIPLFPTDEGARAQGAGQGM